MSGYTQDYLGYLIRQGEIKGKKVGRNWFTTKAEVDEYLFKKKIRNEEFAVKDFFSRRRTINILTFTSIVSIAIFSFFFFQSNFSMKKSANKQDVEKNLPTDVEVSDKISLQ